MLIANRQAMIVGNGELPRVGGFVPFVVGAVAARAALSLASTEGFGSVVKMAARIDSRGRT